MILLIVLAVVAVLLACWLIWKGDGPKPNEGTHQVIVELHLIRRRLNVAQFKIETRREAADLRRKLRDELRELDKREHEP